MSDLINRADAVISLKEELYPCESDYDEGYVAGIKKAIWVIEKWLPSAEPEIIRCKDCKYWQKTTLKASDGKPIYDCPYWPEEFGWTHPEGFCSGAERRTDEEADIS